MREVFCGCAWDCGCGCALVYNIIYICIYISSTTNIPPFVFSADLFKSVYASPVVLGFLCEDFFFVLGFPCCSVLF